MISEHAQKLWQNLLELGPRRLIALAVIGITVFIGVGAGAYYLSRPELDVLYSGLGREDVSRIGATLRDANIPFDVNTAGDTVMVRHGLTTQARVLLAEKGLPTNASGGYELFDKIGSLGLTSFMQEVTRVRALEGEIARTIQVMKGVKAARVHIVMQDRGSFRRERQPPSASVVIRTDSPGDGGTAQAIQYLVAAAVPGMTVDRVTVLTSDGTLLLSGEDGKNAASGRMSSLERTVSRSIQENIRKTLVPYLGLENFEVNVATNLNTDKRQINETNYDPNTRVERSVRVIRDKENSQNSNKQLPTTVEQNLPEARVDSSGGEQSNNEKNRREDVTNYEISSRTVTTVSDGYTVNKLFIAILVNRPRLAAALGEGATQQMIDSKVAEISKIAATAGGLDAQRGDQIQVTAVDFLDSAREIEPVPAMGIVELLSRQLGNVLNAVTILVVAMCLIWFGLRPAVNAILAQPSIKTAANEAEAAAAIGTEFEGAATAQLDGAEPNLIEDLTDKMKRAPMKRLEQIVQLNEEQAAAILRQWMRQEEMA